jgi:hypothetical protein
MDIDTLSTAFPSMDDDDYAHLRDSIRRYGVREPVVTYQGKIIDGRHRWKAAQELGLPCPTVEWDGEGSVVDFVIDKNLNRRHLTPSQRAAAAARLMPFFTEEAARRQHHDASANMDDAGKAREKAAKATGASPRMVQDAIRVQRESPKLLDRVVAGEISVKSARLKLPEPTPTEKPAEQRDAIADTLGRASEFMAIARSLHDIKRQVQSIAGQAIGRELRMQHIEAHIDNAATSIRHAAPHARCECGGRKVDCAACQGMGWVTKEQKARQKESGA